MVFFLPIVTAIGSILSAVGGFRGAAASDRAAAANLEASRKQQAAASLTAGAQANAQLGSGGPERSGSRPLELLQQQIQQGGFRG